MSPVSGRLASAYKTSAPFPHIHYPVPESLPNIMVINTYNTQLPQCCGRVCQYFLKELRKSLATRDFWNFIDLVKRAGLSISMCFGGEKKCGRIGCWIQFSNFFLVGPYHIPPPTNCHSGIHFVFYLS